MIEWNLRRLVSQRATTGSMCSPAFTNEFREHERRRKEGVGRLEYHPDLDGLIGKESCGTGREEQAFRWYLSHASGLAAARTL